MLDRTVVVAVEKRARELHALVVLLRRATADARAEALLHLEADAARGARKDAEQLGLIGEVHRLVGRAIAQAEHVVQLAHGLADALRALKRTVVDRRVVVARSADDDELGRRPRVSLMKQ